MHGRLDDIAPQLLSVEWCELRLLLTLLDPFMYVQNKLESDKVTGSLVVTIIWDVLTSLRDVLEGFRELAPNEDEVDVLQPRAMLFPCCQALLKGFKSCWATGRSS